MSPSRIANCVLQLSNYFIDQPNGKTPWEHEWAQIAYTHYYYPLNRLRSDAIISEAIKRNFFDGLTDFYDFGAGLGSATLALINSNHQWNKKCLIEISSNAQSIAQKLFPELNHVHWQRDIHHHDIKSPQSSLACFSYSLTELNHLPDWAIDCEAILIIEPATEQDGRKLIQLRSELIDKGYTIYAPCTHQLECPLLVDSKHDWCHHRIIPELSHELKTIEAHLPMKNHSLTMSYLLARKSPMKTPTAGLTRIVGDYLVEKGKTRQMICRGPHREFLTIMDRTGIEFELKRNQLIQIENGVEKKSNELRITDLKQIQIID